MKVLVLLFIAGFFCNNLFGQLQSNSFIELKKDLTSIKEMQSTPPSGVISISYLERQPNESRRAFRNRRREARAAVKEMEKQNFRPRLTSGSAYAQYMRLYWMMSEMYICERTQSQIRAPRPLWAIESKRESASVFSIAETKARNHARDFELAVNLGNEIKGRIETGHNFVNGEGVSINEELMESTGAYNLIFAEELIANQVITQFYKKEGDVVTVEISIAMNMDDFITSILNISTQEIRERVRNNIEDVRSRIPE